MPIDPMLTNAIFKPFSDMVEDCKAQNLSGEDFDKMCEMFNRMNELAQTHDDFNAFNGQIMQENLYVKFSNHYGRLFAAKAQQEQEVKGYDDSTLLKQSVDALKNAVIELRKSKQNALDINSTQDVYNSMEQGLEFAQRNQGKFGLSISDRNLKKMKEEARKDLDHIQKQRPAAFDNSAEIQELINNETIIDAIEKVIHLGEQEGMSFPRFLKIQIERGLDRAMEGVTTIRDGYEYLLAWSNAMKIHPYDIKINEEKIAAYDRLASLSDFNLPHIDQLNFEHEKIDYKYKPNVNKWEEVKRRWENMLDDLSQWSLAYTQIAPVIEPWKLSKNPHQAVKETQGITPGIFKQRERLLNKYFDIRFLDIFKHPSFQWQVNSQWISYSQEFVEFLIEKVYPECLPNNKLSKDVIAQRKAFYKEKREMNPEDHMPLERVKIYYDSKFGNGRHEAKYGKAERYERNASPWEWNAFKYK